MGLKTSHGCWGGSYGAFSRFRHKVSEFAGYGDLDRYYGFGGSAYLPVGCPIAQFLNHSDCDGEIRWDDCARIADALETLVPSAERWTRVSGDTTASDLKDWITGLRGAHEAKENVEFH